MRISDLRDKKVKSVDGVTFGRVHDVHCKDGRVTSLMCGPGSLVERWTGRNKGQRIPWDEVRAIESGAVIVAPSRTREAP
jgi:sporulation protein YlmC with PRC-barrel domain